ncbi:Hypothetical predicted protein [Cloeon dipterum]|uniref:LITAF domain-containing protein n=1 Tax=Cloeon dipterum TaxID=197152 RepID=A0A8S1DKC6_9INSE|nr:Hypothetical predicted protein [Cloeon dipterum]
MPMPSAPPSYEDSLQQQPSQPVQPASAQEFVIISAVLNRTPIRVTCPNCMENVVTVTEEKPRLLAHIICGALVVFGCWFCCCLPYCFDSLRKVEHTCPNCDALVGVYISGL